MEIVPVSEVPVKPKRGRPKNEAPGKKVEPTLNPEQFACLERLVALGYGSSPAEVARFLIQREIDDMKRSGLLPANASEGRSIAPVE